MDNCTKRIRTGVVGITALRKEFLGIKKFIYFGIMFVMAISIFLLTGYINEHDPKLG